MLNENRLKQKFKAAFSKAATENNIDSVAGDLAAAVIAEIKEMQITYKAGLVAPNGAVTGAFNYTIT